MTNSQSISFWKFLREHSIKIPIIQRDYAQGRKGKGELRKSFLENLKQALDGKLPNGEKVLKLDFIYGSEKERTIFPLDGQQRLTTLWLLHWYVAMRAGKLSDATDNLKKFSYETRISSREFCEQLCNSENFKNFNEGKITDFITKQTWFYSAWKQDPTIQSMLRMLSGLSNVDGTETDFKDGIEKIFKETDVFTTYWEKLIDENDCPIVFYHLPLKDFGLSDDLYIKMNARGKPLTSFENFKADLIGYIQQQSKDHEDEVVWKQMLYSQDGFAIKLDTSWTDIFWKNKSVDNEIDEIYFAFINRFFWNVLFVAKDLEYKYVLDIGKGEEGSTQENNNTSYSYLNDSKNSTDFDVRIAYKGLSPYKYLNGEIPKEIFLTLKNILDNYYNYSKTIAASIPECYWNKNFEFIPKYDVDNSQKNIEIKNNSNENILKVTQLNQVERIVFFAVCKYFNHEPEKEIDDEKTLKQWLRVVWNLVSGEDQNGRPQIRSTSAMRTAIEFIDSLDSHNVYSSLSIKSISGTSDFEKRCWEEVEKAKQILKDGKRQDGKTWEEIIVETEKYAFFKGSIRFLFIDSKKCVDWNNFDTKWNNVKSLVPLEENNRHTIEFMIPFLRDEDIKNIFSHRNLSNSDKNLKALFWGYPFMIHNFLMNQEKCQSMSILQKDLVLLSKKDSSCRIHIKWKDEKDVLSNYTERRGYYESFSYFIGNTFIRDRLIVLKELSKIKNVEIVDENTKILRDNDWFVWKGLYIEFVYDKKYKFRWQSNNQIDMCNENGLNTNYLGNEPKSFKDAVTLKNELDRCCLMYNQKCTS